MSNKIMVLACACALLLPLSTACTSQPNTFVKVINTDWTTMPLREGLTGDQAWRRATDVIARKFELEMTDRDAQYTRSSWKYTIPVSGKEAKWYRTRVLFMVQSDQSVFRLKVEAQFGGEGKWINGYDTNVLENMKQDINAIIGL